ncbi:MAG TPA: NADP-dependent malic enzyme [Candidatus Paceibacterota bacterium]|nr:NADP-dependent malic enzyme [Candidatus Paceibacterota bacterium]
MDELYQQAVDLHRRHHGKLAVVSKVPLADRRDLSLAYTPGVAEVCRAIAADKGQSHDLTLRHNTIAVVSDGSAILGLGNLGPEAALPVMEGKALLFKEFAGVDAFPLCLATQDTEEIIETVKRLAPTFGGINLEDISAPRCFEIERRLRTELSIPVMHDDQHGTAVVVLAGLINALKLKDLKKEDARIAVNGAGAAGTAIVKILLAYGFRDLVVCDSKGAISKKRADLNDEKIELANITNEAGVEGGLAEVVANRDIFIGVSKAGVLSASMVRSMREKPVIFAMANPVPEIMPEEAKAAGAYIVATGRSDFPNQVNNVLAFPGIFRGALDRRIGQFTEMMFIKAAENIADHIADPTPDYIIPDPFDREVAPKVADAIR